MALGLRIAGENRGKGFYVLIGVHQFGRHAFIYSQSVRLMELGI